VIAATDCVFCRAEPYAYLENTRWRVLRHADPVPVAGWMVLAAREHRSGLDELTAAEAGELGVILSALSQAVRAETGAERKYAITFNEAVPHLHVHVIPRHAGDPTTTSWALADRYRATARGECAPAAPADAERIAHAIATRVEVSLASLALRAPRR
jgi:diadenosine tetraphosphate (Ap4A) HIT family hydrolase